MPAQPLDIPLTQGELQNFDPKLMPQGGLKRAENVRIRRDGRFGKRLGYGVYQTALTGSVQGVYTLGDRHCVMASGHFYTRHPSTGVWQDVGYQPTWIAREERGVASTIAYGPSSVGGAYVNGYSCSVFIAANSSGVQQFASAVVQDEATGVVVRDDTLPVTSRAIVQALRVVVVGTAFVAVWIEVTGGVATLRHSTLETASIALYAGWTANVNIATTATGFYKFDACEDGPGGSSSYLAVYQTTGSQITAARITTAGAISVSANIATTADAIAPAIQHCSERIYVAWHEQTAGAIKGLSYTTALATPTAAATASTSVNNDGHPVISRLDSTHALIFWGEMNGLKSGLNARPLSNAGTFGVSFYYGGFLPASKPFVIGTYTYLFVCTATLTDSQKTYQLVSVADGAVQNGSLWQLAPMVSFAQNAAKGEGHAPNRAYVTSNGYVWTAPVDKVDNLTGGATGLVVCRFAQASASVDLRRQSVVVNGALYLAGGAVSEFDGMRLFELGFSWFPWITATAAAAGGSMTASSSYQYVAVYEYYDALGQRHRSQPSNPVTQATGVGQGTVNVTVAACGLTSKGHLGAANTGTYAQQGIVLYRTLAGGSVFYRVTGITADPATADYYTITDTAADTSISANEVLYVQGGPLPHATPPPARFIAAGADRVILGGLSQTDEVLISKIVVSGEPVQFADHDAFRARVGAPVTAVWVLDGAFIVFTADNVFLVVGQGPDDSGNGSFDVPRRLPSDVGCTDARSLLEVPAGLMFQSRRGIYLLPRGGGAPQYVGQPVQDRLDAYPIVTSAALVANADENTARFTLSDAAGTNGIVVALDLRTGQWMTDLHTPTGAFVASDVWSGYWVGARLDISLGVSAEVADLYQDSALPSSSYYQTSTLELGDLRPFGIQGRGLVRTVQILGEYRDATTITIAASYDGGVTYPDSQSWALSGTAGAQVVREWGIPRIQIDEVRFKLTDAPTTATGEGFVFNALTLQVEPRAGARRFASGER